MGKAASPPEGSRDSPFCRPSQPREALSIPCSRSLLPPSKPGWGRQVYDASFELCLLHPLPLFRVLEIVWGPTGISRMSTLPSQGLRSPQLQGPSCCVMGRAPGARGQEGRSVEAEEHCPPTRSRLSRESCDPAPLAHGRAVSLVFVEGRELCLCPLHGSHRAPLPLS